MFICIFEMNWRKTKHYEFQLQNWQQLEEVQCKNKSKFIRDLEFSETAKNYMLSGPKNSSKGISYPGLFSPLVK